MSQPLRPNPSPFILSVRQLYSLILGRDWSYKLLIAMMGLSLLALSRCNSKPSDPLALMLKSETGCTLPCWLGIVPGLSSEIDFGKIAEANPDRFDDLKRNTFGLRFVQFIWRDRVMDGLMSSELEDNVFTHITMQFEADIDLQTAIDQLGVPDSYASQLTTGEASTIVLYLFYEDRGVVVETTMLPNEVQPVACSYSLPDSLVIQRLHLSPVATARVTLDTLPQLFPDQLSPSPWAGPGTLQLSSCHP